VGSRETQEGDQVYVVVALYVTGATAIALSVGVVVFQDCFSRCSGSGVTYLYECLLIHDAKVEEISVDGNLIQSVSPFAVDAFR